MNTWHLAKILCGDVIGNRILAPGPGHSRRDRSLSIHIDPAAPDGFIVHSFAGDDWRECRDYVRQHVGYSRWQPTRSSKPSSPNPSLRVSNGGDTSAKAKYLWGKSKSIEGSPAETYLRVCRGVQGPIPATLRYLPPTKKHPPAMIAAFTMAVEIEPGVLCVQSDAVRAVQMISLTFNGLAKAGIPEPKKIIGRGASGVPIILAPPNDLLGLAITEGIEDALSIHAATGLGAWAAGGGPRMPALAESVPDYIDYVTIFADDDRSGRDGALGLLLRLQRRGISAQIKKFSRNGKAPNA